MVYSMVHVQLIFHIIEVKLCCTASCMAVIGTYNQLVGSFSMTI